MQFQIIDLLSHDVHAISPLIYQVYKSPNWGYGSIHIYLQNWAMFSQFTLPIDIAKLIYQYVITANSVEIFQGNRREMTLVNFGPVTSTNEADVHHDLP